MKFNKEESFYKRLMDEYNNQLNYSGIDGERIAARLYKLSKIGSNRFGGVNRSGYSNEEKEAKDLIISWMKEADLKVNTDGAGNIFGRLDGKTEKPAIASGSHVDSVPNGGNFDGPLGVIAALEVVEAWKTVGYKPMMPYEVAIFSDEEGSRFKSGLTGSRSFMGQINKQELENFIDEDGKSFKEVIENYGSSEDNFLASNNRNFALFAEVHIEQGKVLENANQPVGIVSGIAGPAWLEVTFNGEAGHAGNTPMTNRKDPLVAAGIFVKEIENLPGQVNKTAVATVGKLNVIPNGVNVIPQSVNMTVDIRDIQKSSRDKLVELVSKKAESIAAQREISVKLNINTKITPLPIKKELQERMAQSLSKFDIEPIYIPSGAGHDSMILGEEIPVAMLFVRSKDGISHNPDEWSSLNDCVMSIHVLKDFIENIMEERI